MEENIFTLPHATAAKVLSMAYSQTDGAPQTEAREGGCLRRELSFEETYLSPSLQSSQVNVASQHQHRRKPPWHRVLSVGLRWGGRLAFLKGQKATGPGNVDIREGKPLSSNSSTVVPVAPFHEWV